MSIADGSILFNGNKSDPNVKLIGDLTFGDTTNERTIKFITKNETYYLHFVVDGNITWNRGDYQPRQDGDNAGKSDMWSATGTFTVGANAKLDPQITGAPLVDASWTLIYAKKGITGTAVLPGGLQEEYEVLTVTVGDRQDWKLRRKE